MFWEQIIISAAEFDSNNDLGYNLYNGHKYEVTACRDAEAYCRHRGGVIREE